MVEYTKEKIEELRQQRHEEDMEAIKKYTKKYGFDVTKYTKTSDNWHHGLIWNRDEITKDLRKCPFCGGQGEICDYEYEDGMRYSIICQNCNAETNDYDEILDAFIAWNKRFEE